MSELNKTGLVPFHSFYNFFILFLLIILHTVSCHGCIDRERNALLNFKASLTDPSGRLSSWQVNSHRNCCDWHGIQCSATDSLHVISIDLRNVELENNMFNSLFPNTSLSGIISPLSKFKNLVHLDISYSQFSGSITTQFSNLSSLRYLDVSKYVPHSDPTSLTHRSSMFRLESPSIDWVRKLVNLRVLRLSGVSLMVASLLNNWAEPISFLADLRELHLSACGISGPVFPIRELLNLSRLSYLEMNFNFLISPIPTQIANLTSLSVLELAGCFGLQGSVPYLPQLERLDIRGNSFLQVNLESMFERQWPKLQALWIFYTNVSGSIPSTISNAPLLVSLLASECLIKGSLPTTLSALSHLEYLDLSTNGITSYLPSSVSNMKRLQHLSLSGNNLEGPIPGSICQLTSLQQLKLNGNKFSGTMPSCVTKLRTLSYFDISGNAIGGTISLNPLINQLSLTRLNLNNNKITVQIDQQIFPSQYQLESLELQSCNISGDIPAFICKFNNLNKLDMSQNSLTGAIPSCLFKHQNLTELDLSRNHLQGALPRVLQFNADNLMSINLGTNNLTGSLPLPSQRNILFDLSQNQFTGGIPFEVGERLSSTRYSSLSDNHLTGPIPHSFCSNKADEAFGVETLNLYNNRLSGNIPSSLGNCSSLFYLHLAINNLTGYIPNELGRITSMRYLLLHNNLLGGAFPEVFQEFDNLNVLTLGNNNFEGNIPSFIGSFQVLRVLSLASNAFSGSITKDISNLNELQILDLSFNNFSGTIHGMFGNVTMLRSGSNNTAAFSYGYVNRGGPMADLQVPLVIKGALQNIQQLRGYSSGIDLSSNSLEGNIPDDVVLLKGLYMLNLSNNHFHGKIPAGIGNMTSLEALDLRFNKLSGKIPTELVSLSYLAVLNLSYNNLSGRIPEDKHFQTLSLDGSAYLGNDLLCGVPIKKRCEGDPIGPTSSNTNDNTGEDDEDGAREKILLIGSVILGVGVGFWGLFLGLLCRKEKWWFGYWRVINIIVVKITSCTWEK
ncbi:hypothetical protein MKW92_006704 [Papaver armeniacum]|nr:hypothetical protein MKW92_006704 [Papaver armeniacum]